MQGDLSLIQNGSINKNNLLAVPMLQGGKVQFSQRAKSIVPQGAAGPGSHKKRRVQLRGGGRREQLDAMPQHKLFGDKNRQLVELPSQYHSIDASRHDHQTPLVDSRSDYVDQSMLIPNAVLNKYRDMHLPQIQTVKNTGFSGSALHQVKKPTASKVAFGALNPGIKEEDQKKERPKIERRKFRPVNHYISNQNMHNKQFSNMAVGDVDTQEQKTIGNRSKQRPSKQSLSPKRTLNEAVVDVDREILHSNPSRNTININIHNSYSIAMPPLIHPSGSGAFSTTPSKEYIIQTEPGQLITPTPKPAVPPPNLDILDMGIYGEKTSQHHQQIPVKNQSPAFQKQETFKSGFPGLKKLTKKESPTNKPGADGRLERRGSTVAPKVSFFV